jgi:hypothetical protein
MSTLRRICAATILSLTLAVAVMAGDIDSPGKTSTSTTSTTSVTTTVIVTIINLIFK